jgi:hypothetical protein
MDNSQRQDLLTILKKDFSVEIQIWRFIIHSKFFDVYQLKKCS